MKKILKLFFIMLKIGLFTFGGGYAMVALLEDEFVTKRNWLDSGEFTDMVAIAESTPGPVAVNMATFIGSSQGGIAGALVATLGVILPSFAVILAICIILKKILKYGGVQAALKGVAPAVVGLILSTAVIMFLGNVAGIDGVWSQPSFDWKALVIFGLVFLIAAIYYIIRKKNFSPIILLLVSGVLGIAFYI